VSRKRKQGAGAATIEIEVETNASVNTRSGGKKENPFKNPHEKRAGRRRRDKTRRILALGGVDPDLFFRYKSGTGSSKKLEEIRKLSLQEEAKGIWL